MGRGRSDCLPLAIHTEPVSVCAHPGIRLPGTPQTLSFALICRSSSPLYSHALQPSPHTQASLPLPSYTLLRLPRLFSPLQFLPGPLSGHLASCPPPPLGLSCWHFFRKPALTPPSCPVGNRRSAGGESGCWVTLVPPARAGGPGSQGSVATCCLKE